MIQLLNFQREAVQNLLETVTNVKSKDIIVLKSPTGSGKTVMLINFIDDYINTIDKNIAFIWLCPGKGNLEEQSHDQMINLAPNRDVKTLQEALLAGFEEGSTTFVNWEMVTKTGNKAITESEEKNLYDRIAEAHRRGRRFIILVDEEHSNDTNKAQSIINAFAPLFVIRVSATAHENPNAEFIEIDEQDVIDEGIIAKAIYVNEDIENGITVEDETKFLLEKGNKKRQEIKEEYKKLGIDINPLVVIQLANDKNAKIERTEKVLEEMGYTYDNKMVGVWLADKKENIDNLKNLNDEVSFLIMKQAISTGWDCPRAKILIKLREAGNEDFEIQTIGRIRRMPERKQYNNEVLDNCYVYTFDEQYTSGLFGQVDRAYSVVRLYIKDDPIIKDFKLQKGVRDENYSTVDARKVATEFLEHMQNKYHLDKDYNNNKEKLEANGYIIGTEVINDTLSGKFVKTTDVETEDKSKRIRVGVIANTHVHGISLMHSRFEIHKAALVSNEDISSILLNSFNEDGEKKYRILELDNPMYYAFIINNEHQLKEEFREINAEVSVQYKVSLENEKEWKIPIMDIIRYDPNERNNKELVKNVYEGYTGQMVNSVCGKSMSEILFEKYCEQANNIKYVYKNGDNGDEYFCVVYSNGIGTQKLFYPDYILIMNDGSHMIIETKGGEARGKSKNIDKQVQNKFNAFKLYAKQNEIKWGFVRDKDAELYFNNTEYVDDMSNDNWKPISELLDDNVKGKSIIDFSHVKNKTEEILGEKLAANIDLGALRDILDEDDK